MNKKLALTGLPLLLISSITFAQESTESIMLQTRTQLQTDMQSMSAEDRELYQQLNDTGKGSGNMIRRGDGSGNGSGDKKRLRDGSGNGSGKMNRYGQSEGGYGSGYGSRNGGGQGRR